MAKLLTYILMQFRMTEFHLFARDGTRLSVTQVHLDVIKLTEQHSISMLILIIQLILTMF